MISLARELDFGDVVVGGSRVLPVPLAGATVDESKISISEPFFVLPAIPLDPHGPPRIAFRPTDKGVFTADLQVDFDGSRLRSHVSGTGRLPADCHPNACETQTRSPDKLSCALERKPDGTDCAEACVVAGECRAGVCVGSPRGCDDRNVCTDDACDPEHGCVHRAIECPKNANPCIATGCDRTTGCGFLDVIDGESCGSSALDVTHRCRAITCREEPSWEPTSDCDADSPATLASSWSLHFGSAVVGEPALDSEGRLAVVSCATTGCELLSIDMDGRVLARLPTTTPARGQRRVLAANGLLVVAGDTDVWAHEEGSLAVRWKLSVAGEFAPTSHGIVGGIARLSADTLAIGVFDAGDDVAPGADSYMAMVLYVETSSGAVLSRDEANREGVAASDGNGALFTAHAGNTWDSVIRRQPGVRDWWTTASAFVREVEVWRGLVFAAEWAFESGSGVHRYSVPGAEGAVAVSDDLAFVTWRQPADPALTYAISAFRWSDGAPFATCATTHWTMLFATSRQSVLALFLGHGGQFPDVLREFDVRGEVRSIGTLAGDGSTRRAIVVAGRFIAVKETGGSASVSTLVAYPLPPGLDLAAHGWVMEGGNPSRDFTPR